MAIWKIFVGRETRLSRPSADVFDSQTSTGSHYFGVAINASGSTCLARRIFSSRLFFFPQPFPTMQSKNIEVIKVKENFLSLRAKEDIPTGAFLSDLWGPVYDSPTLYTVQIAEDKHIDPQGPPRFTNHSCTPNAKFVFGVYDPSHLEKVPEGQALAWHMVAQKEIRKGEDITFDYTTTEYEMDAPFSCLCGADSCLGTVKGFRFLSREDRLKRKACVSPAIKESLIQKSCWIYTVRSVELK